MKVLQTIREILKFKKYTTISEISKFSKVSQIEILKILNFNIDYVNRDNKTGRIFGVNLHTPLHNQLFSQGKIFISEPENYGCINVLKFNGHDDIRKKYEKPYVCGGFGDSYTIQCIIDGAEVREALEKDGCFDAKNYKYDDRLLWKEQ
jgi:hypothetical protein